eukprot:TRINITY_DN3295_c3_g5_i1.p1 TRINITY_DN3295_c3_g5~~TRINITY_DN3295_c3_g5_i1.p1  ORF type:complete len:1025 (-),score=338.30 TRINITY_DN3295_c3_g5_i1:243-3317(-)
MINGNSQFKNYWEIREQHEKELNYLQDPIYSIAYCDSFLKINKANSKIDCVNYKTDINSVNIEITNGISHIFDGFSGVFDTNESINVIFEEISTPLLASLQKGFSTTCIVHGTSKECYYDDIFGKYSSIITQMILTLFNSNAQDIEIFVSGCYFSNNAILDVFSDEHCEPESNNQHQETFNFVLHQQKIEQNNILENFEIFKKIDIEDFFVMRLTIYDVKTNECVYLHVMNLLNEKFCDINEDLNAKYIINQIISGKTEVKGSKNLIQMIRILFNTNKLVQLFYLSIDQKDIATTLNHLQFTAELMELKTNLQRKNVSFKVDESLKYISISSLANKRDCIQTFSNSFKHNVENFDYHRDMLNFIEKQNIENVEREKKNNDDSVEMTSILTSPITSITKQQTKLEINSKNILNEEIQTKNSQNLNKVLSKLEECNTNFVDDFYVSTTQETHKKDIFFDINETKIKNFQTFSGLLPSPKNDHSPSPKNNCIFTAVPSPKDDYNLQIPKNDFIAKNIIESSSSSSFSSYTPLKFEPNACNQDETSPNDSVENVDVNMVKDTKSEGELVFINNHNCSIDSTDDSVFGVIDYSEDKKKEEEEDDDEFFEISHDPDNMKTIHLLLKKLDEKDEIITKLSFENEQNNELIREYVQKQNIINSRVVGDELSINKEILKNNHKFDQSKINYEREIAQLIKETENTSRTMLLREIVGLKHQISELKQQLDRQIIDKNHLRSSRADNARNCRKIKKIQADNEKLTKIQKDLSSSLKELQERFDNTRNLNSTLQKQIKHQINRIISLENELVSNAAIDFQNTTIETKQKNIPIKSPTIPSNRNDIEKEKKKTTYIQQSDTLKKNSNASNEVFNACRKKLVNFGLKQLQTNKNTDIHSCLTNIFLKLGDMETVSDKDVNFEVLIEYLKIFLEQETPLHKEIRELAHIINSHLEIDGNDSALLVSKRLLKQMKFQIENGNVREVLKISKRFCELAERKISKRFCFDLIDLYFDQIKDLDNSSKASFISILTDRCYKHL